MRNVIAIWNPDSCDEEDWNAERDATKWRATKYRIDDVAAAAEWFAEQEFGVSDYPQFQSVCVRTDDGELHRFEVETETVPTFRATRLNP